VRKGLADGKLQVVETFKYYHVDPATMERTPYDQPLDIIKGTEK